jgi:uncharacterized protein (DUF433 family)
MSVFTLTDYRYITRVPDICGGRPIIKGTRLPVQTIVGYYKLGLDVEEILEGLPQLTPAQVYEALSYYHDFAAEIDQDIEASRLERVLAREHLTVTPDGRLTPLAHER